MGQTDRRRDDGRTDGRIVPLLNAAYTFGGGGIISSWTHKRRRTEFACVAVLTHACTLFSHAYSAPRISAHALRCIQFRSSDAVVDAVVLVPLTEIEPRADRVPSHAPYRTTTLLSH